MYAAVYARVGTLALAASQIVSTLEGIFIVGYFGLMSAATVLIGRALGAGDAPGARLGWPHHPCGTAHGRGVWPLFALSRAALPGLFPRSGQMCTTSRCLAS